MGDHDLPGLECVFQPELEREVADHGKPFRLGRLHHRPEDLRRQRGIDLDQIVAARLLPADLERGPRRVVERDEGRVARRIAVQGGTGGVDRRSRDRAEPHLFAPGTRARAAVEVEHGGHAVREVVEEIRVAVEMDVHVGQPGHERGAAPVDPQGVPGYVDRSARAHREDPIAADEHGLVGERARGVHREDANPLEDDRVRLPVLNRVGNPARAGEEKPGDERRHQCAAEDPCRSHVGKMGPRALRVLYDLRVRPSYERSARRNAEGVVPVARRNARVRLA